MDNAPLRGPFDSSNVSCCIIIFSIFDRHSSIVTLRPTRALLAHQLVRPPSPSLHGHPPRPASPGQPRPRCNYAPRFAPLFPARSLAPPCLTTLLALPHRAYLQSRLTTRPAPPGPVRPRSAHLHSAHSATFPSSSPCTRFALPPRGLSTHLLVRPPSPSPPHPASHLPRSNYARPPAASLSPLARGSPSPAPCRPAPPRPPRPARARSLARPTPPSSPRLAPPALAQRLRLALPPRPAPLARPPHPALLPAAPRPAGFALPALARPPRLARPALPRPRSLAPLSPRSLRLARSALPGWGSDGAQCNDVS